MLIYQIITVIILFTTVFAYVNDKYIKWPSTIGIMALSLMASLIIVMFGSFVPATTASLVKLIKTIDFQQVLLQVMLGFLLFAGAMQVDYQKLRKEVLLVLVLATLGVLISTFLVSVLSYYLFALFQLPVPYIYCLLFGTLISPTDPIAVMGILRKAGIPESLELKITGESLFNDGVAVVLFLTVTEVAVMGADQMTVWRIGSLFLREAIGGLVFGTALGYLGYFILRSINNYRVEVLITLSMVMPGYALASYLHVSGALAMVVAGLMLGNKVRNTAMSRKSWDYLGKFWGLIDEIFNAVLFLLIGFEMLVVEITLPIVSIGLAMILAVLFARWVSVLFPVWLLRGKIKFEKNALTILTWGGLRGALSVALALSIPATMHKNEFVLITYIIVVFSIMIQGLTIGKLSHRLR
ncbi:MAG: cation:proton antiporter [Mucilaginibacter sp.]|uniref:cation:proton antiporter n=1 Tax=Mucilaginibacter sp. TaxID=1882438 RepID=UPI0034E417D0